MPFVIDSGPSTGKQTSASQRKVILHGVSAAALRRARWKSRSWKKKRIQVFARASGGNGISLLFVIVKRPETMVGAGRRRGEGGSKSRSTVRTAAAAWLNPPRNSSAFLHFSFRARSASPAGSKFLSPDDTPVDTYIRCVVQRD